MVVTHERLIELEGNFNFRDLGGYETVDGRVLRWRRLFRSDALHRLTAGDVRRLRSLGLVEVYDLRSEYELQRHGLGPLYEAGVIHHHTPFITDVNPETRSYSDGLHPLYVQMLESARPSIARIFERLALDSSYPAVFHCSAGKDRTGVLSALVLRMLGVADEVIVEDYALSGTYIAPYLEARWEAGDLGHARNIPKSLLRADPESMHAILNVVDEECGPGAAYLSGAGVSDQVIEGVRDRLLVEPNLM